MRQREVVFAPEAREDLRQLYTAFGYIDGLLRNCHGMSHGAERGHKRDDIRPGLRIVGFERRLTIAFAVSETQVTILRLFYVGRNWEPMLV